MISQTLRDARRYEDAMAQNITPLERPEFHLSPKVGWMNDPNGFSYYKDKFHLFYQYYPYDSQWGPMLYLFLQRYIVEGVTSGAVKG